MRIWFSQCFFLVGAKRRTLTWWQRGQGSSCTQRFSTLPMSERHRASNDISRPVKRFTPWVTMRLWCRRLELHVILEAKTPADTRWVCKYLWFSVEGTLDEGLSHWEHLTGHQCVQVGTPAMLFEEMHKDGVVPKRFNVNQLRRQFFHVRFKLKTSSGPWKPENTISLLFVFDSHHFCNYMRPLTTISSYSAPF